MAQARAEHDWSHTASVMALIAECHRNPKHRTKPFQPDDFNPFRRKKAVPLTKEEFRSAFKMGMRKGGRRGSRRD